MRNILLIVILCAITLETIAQKPHYLPGDGVYIVGIPASRNTTYKCPVMVTEAYQATFKTTGAELASITADKSYNISNRLQADGTLDLKSFMGCGSTTKLIVRNFDGESYTIGDYAPAKTWNTTYLVAACAPWDGKDAYTLGVYDHWDCPVTDDADEMFTSRNAKGITVDFGNPHEGLVCSCVNFNLVSKDATMMKKLGALTIRVDVFDNNRKSVVRTEKVNVRAANVRVNGTTEDGNTIYSIYVYFDNPLIIAQPFTVGIDGFDKLESQVWLPRAVDSHNLYPTHTTYHLSSGDEQVAQTDACVNIEGYFNYVGLWGWYDGKCEYGECVAQGDYVQVYIDPSDPDWPGMFFTGDPTFPVECTFGLNDLIVDEKPDWISEIQIDGSQWDNYGALLIIMTAAGLPSGETGRYGKVVISTLDEASKYTIHIRQGNGVFPSTIEGVSVDVPASGGTFDLTGRRIAAPMSGQLYIKDGKKILKK